MAHSFIFMRRIVSFLDKCRWPFISLLFYAITAIFILILLLYISTTGFDFTDEGFYYVNYEYPVEYSGNSLSLFNRVYSPLYYFLGRDIFLFRILDLFSVVGIALFAARYSLSRNSVCQLRNYFHFKFAPLLISIFFSLFALLNYQLVVLSPSYNSLAFIACAMFFIGASSMEKLAIEISQKSSSSLILFYKIISPLIIGISFSISWLAKPTTFAALFIVYWAYIAALYAFRAVPPKFLIKSVAASLALFSLIIVVFVCHNFAGFSGYVADVNLSLYYSSLLQSGHTSIAEVIHRFLSLARLIFPITFLAVWQLLAMNVFLGRKRQSNHYHLAKKIFLLLTIALLFVCVSSTYSLSQICISGLYSLPFVFFVSLLFKHGLFYESFQEILHASVAILPMSKPTLALAILSFSLPLAFAFGTNVGYEGKISCSIFFVILASHLCLQSLPAYDSASSRIKNYTLFLLALFTPSLCALLLILYGIISPYRRDTFLFQPQSTAMIHSTSLRISKSRAEFVKLVSASLGKSGFVDNTPVLDLGNGLPGLIYAVKGFPLGRPWMITGYKGSKEYFSETLTRSGCSARSRAWLFIQSPSSADLNIASDFPDLASIGLKSINQYELVFTAELPRSLHRKGNSQYFHVYKPSLHADLAHCSD